MLIKCENCLMWGRASEESDERKCNNPMSTFYNHKVGKNASCPFGIDIACPKNKNPNR